VVAQVEHRPESRRALRAPGRSAGEARGEPLDAVVDQRLVDEAEREPHRVGAAPVREEERARGRSDAGLRRARRKLVGAAPSGSVSQEKNPPAGGPAAPAASSARAPRGGARSSAGTARASARAARRSTRGARLLEEPLAERARALVGVLLRADERDAISAGRPPTRAAPPGRTSSTSCPPGRRRPARRSRGSAASRRRSRARGRPRPRRRGSRSGARARRAARAGRRAG
jgi:hypothetical protein